MSDTPSSLTPADAERTMYEAARRRRHAAEFGDVDDDDAYDADDPP